MRDTRFHAGSSVSREFKEHLVMGIPAICAFIGAKAAAVEAMDEGVSFAGMARTVPMRIRHFQDFDLCD